MMIRSNSILHGVMRMKRGTYQKKKVLLLGNYDEGMYRFRKELICRLVNDGYDVCVATPAGEYGTKLEHLQCQFKAIDFDRSGKKVTAEIGLLKTYFSFLKSRKFDVVLLFTIKPTLYAGFACRLLNIPYIVNITGLSPAITESKWLRKACYFAYRRVLPFAKTVFFQNEENMNLFRKENLIKNNEKLLPGSGINLEEFNYIPYSESNRLLLLYIGRITKVKGIDELLKAIRIIKRSHESVDFEILGKCDEEYKDVLQTMQKEGLLFYRGAVDDVHPYLKMCQAVLLPSYGEGMSNVLLEASASGRPVLASDVAGCREIVQDGVSGILFQSHSAEAIVEAITKFICLSVKEREKMGIYAREYVAGKFSRQIVVENYIREIEIGG